ncbi:MAG: endonuclease/exonuclease/phosphatase family protein [Anaerolineaceae bacterium]|nr:endonuclease/exonuclease/phosphatase family protein [Anaerolineaceae bacterium]
MSRKVLESLLHTIELTLVGLFFVQALRRLPGLLLNPGLLTGDGAGLEESTAPVAGLAAAEALFLLLMLLLPLLAHVRSRSRHALPVCASFVAIARALPVLVPDVSGIVVCSAVIGGGLTFIVFLLKRRVMHFPQLMLLGFAADQVVRAAGNTLDISWTTAWNAPQLLLSALAIAAAFLLARRFQEAVLAEVTAQQGLVTAQGAAGIGALLFLQLSLLSLPNGIAARSGASLQLLTPLLVGATLLPLLSPVRDLARKLLQAFYGGLRGWLWMALIALLLIVGLRLEGMAAALALVLLQFAMSLMWWWLQRPQEEDDRDFSAIALSGALLVTALLLAIDFLTVASPLNAGLFVTNGDSVDLGQRMLLGIRGLGWAILLLAVILTALPMTRSRHRIAWTRETGGIAWIPFLLLLVAVLAGFVFARPQVPPESLDARTFRVATWNLEAVVDGPVEESLESVAQTIAASGADIVLLQNVDAGRSASFWVDQAWWLARRLDMHHAWFPLADGVNGLAVLARAGLHMNDGLLVVGDGQQGGLQRASLDVDGEVLTLYNYWPGQTPRNLQLQIGAMNSLIGSLHNREEPEMLVLAASLDGAPDDALLLPLRAADFQDPFAVLADEFAWTVIQNGEALRSDYLWFRAPLGNKGTGILDAPGMGRRLVLIELSLAT